MTEREFRLSFERCPFCGAEGSCQLFGVVHDIPYFGETIESVITCERCGFRHADVMHTEEREPRGYEYPIETPEDLMTRVVRSSTGMIEIPELDVSIKPGPASEGFVSNVEGVLERVKQAIETALKGAEPSGKKEAEDKLRLLEKIRVGKAKGTLVLRDPRGQSAIVHPKARSWRLELSGT
jgi:zinc finger protein